MDKLEEVRIGLAAVAAQVLAEVELGLSSFTRASSSPALADCSAFKE